MHALEENCIDASRWRICAQDEIVRIRAHETPRLSEAAHAGIGHSFACHPDADARSETLNLLGRNGLGAYQDAESAYRDESIHVRIVITSMSSMPANARAPLQRTLGRAARRTRWLAILQREEQAVVGESLPGAIDSNRWYVFGAGLYERSEHLLLRFRCCFKNERLSIASK